VKKADYVERSTLVAAPILFQTKGTKTAECPFNYSSVFVQRMHLMPLTFVGKTGYADFLSSIADNPFVFRQLQNGSTAGGKCIIFPCAPTPMTAASMLAMTAYSNKQHRIL